MIQKYLVSNRKFFGGFYSLWIADCMKKRYKYVEEALNIYTCKPAIKVISIKKVKRLHCSNSIIYNAKMVQCPVNQEKYHNDVWLVVIETSEPSLLNNPIEKIRHKKGDIYLLKGFVRIA